MSRGIYKNTMSKLAPTLGGDGGPAPITRPTNPSASAAASTRPLGISGNHKGIQKKQSTFSKIGGAIKNIGGKVKYAGEVGMAAGKLAARLKNPVNQAKFVVNAARGKGMVLPGSKYIGPGNEMNKGAPVNEADANAYQHDIDYDNYLKQGHSAKHVYTSYSDADERLLRKTKANTPEGLAVNLGMLAKKGAWKLGLTKRLRDTDIPQRRR